MIQSLIAASFMWFPQGMYIFLLRENRESLSFENYSIYTFQPGNKWTVPKEKSPADPSTVNSSSTVYMYKLLSLVFWRLYML
jgi:hypothetical protein